MLNRGGRGVQSPADQLLGPGNMGATASGARFICNRVDYASYAAPSEGFAR
jgi:hypothetical protein